MGQIRLIHNRTGWPFTGMGWRRVCEGIRAP